MGLNVDAYYNYEEAKDSEERVWSITYWRLIDQDRFLKDAWVAGVGNLADWVPVVIGDNI